MAKFKYHTGDAFNKWTLVSYAGNGKWLARCECGTEKDVFIDHLTTGKSKGCMTCSSERRGTHGMTHSSTYRSWDSMRQRCTNPLNDRFHQYGGRGIKVCERWGEFENFMADMGSRPDGKSLDRVDCDGDYTPDNCRWATPKEQMRNLRSQKASALGISTTEAAENCGLPYGTLQARIKRGWDVERALNEPVRDNAETVHSRARKLGLPPHTVYCRIRRGGM